MNTITLPPAITDTIDDFAELYPSVSTIISEVCDLWPEHTPFIEKRFVHDSPSFLKHSEELAGNILKLSQGNLREHCSDYQWMCNEILKEEYYFTRHKKYRLSTITEACDEVYDNPLVMKRYMYGVLLSQLLWRNHTSASEVYKNSFLDSNKEPFDHLEIGPGHGMFIGQAATHPLSKSVCGWDISQESLRITEESLETLGLREGVTLMQCDVTSNQGEGYAFDSVTISEVLEHVEAPEKVLKGIVGLMRPKGRIFINIPVNSPAPDHIYLWRSPEEIEDMVRSHGLDIVESHYFPLTGYELQQAKDRELSISVVVIAQKPAS